MKFPEYFDLNRQIDGGKLSDIVNILMPPEAGDALPRITVSCPLDMTVGGLLSTVFGKYKTKMGKDLDTDGTGCYIFKVCGYMDYLLHRNFKICYYDHIVFCQRKKIKIELKLMKLGVADKMNIGPILGKTVEEEVAAENEKMKVKDDLWRRHRDLRKSQIARDPRHISMKDSKWPFRCLVRGVQGCPGEVLDVKSLYIEIGLYYNGTLIGQTETKKRLAPNAQRIDPLRTSHVPFSCEPTWPGVWLSSTKHQVSLLPPTTRVGFMLYGVEQGGKSIPLAGVSVTLVDFKNIVLTGEKEFMLWPHQKLQVKRNPELANPKCEKMPHLVDIATGVVGENPENDAGTLHVVFDSYFADAFAEVPCLDDFCSSSTTTNENIDEAKSTTKEDGRSLTPLTPPCFDATPTDAEKVRRRLFLPYFVAAVAVARHCLFFVAAATSLPPLYPPSTLPNKVFSHL